MKLTCYTLGSVALEQETLSDLKGSVLEEVVWLYTKCF